MKPHVTLDAITTPEGRRLSLHEHDGRYSIRCDGQALMDSSLHTSEIQLGQLTVARLTKSMPARVVIGGLGLGFTLKSALSHLGPKAVVQVAELLPAVVAWNRTHLRGLNGALLDDPRVQVVAGDVGRLLAKTARETLDAVALDVDNGPAAMVRGGNDRLYSLGGLKRLHAVLKPGGRATFWSASSDRDFAERLKTAGFAVEVTESRLHENARRAAAVIYIASKAELPRPPGPVLGRIPPRRRY